MRRDEAQALGSLAGETAAGIAGQARDVHAAVAARVFGALARSEVPVEPVRAGHDAIAGLAYRGSRGLVGGLARGAGRLVAHTRPGDAPSLHDGPVGRFALAALSGAVGDRLAAAGSPLAGRLRLIVDPATPLTGRLAVFVHGLGESEDVWRSERPGSEPGMTVDYGQVLAEAGLTPVYVRYNSGQAIADSARDLSVAITGLLADWPGPPVRELTLIGHSMGGLVIREAPLHAGAGPEDWPTRVALVVTLGAPHEGAPLARAARVGAAALERLPETRPFAGPLRDRSAGIRDLADPCTAPFLAGAEHLLVSASVSRDPRAPVGRLLGDLLVHRRSAWAQRTETERLRFPDDAYRHLGGVDHFGLLGHPAVAELLRERVERVERRALTAAPPAR